MDTFNFQLRACLNSVDVADMKSKVGLSCVQPLFTEMGEFQNRIRVYSVHSNNYVDHVQTQTRIQRWHI